MKKLVVFVLLLMLMGAAGSASANLIKNSGFDDGLDYWNTRGDVRIADLSPAAHVGFDGNFALLGMRTGSETSQISQRFDVSGYSAINISFNWAFAYIDYNPRGNDAFLSLLKDTDPNTDWKITLDRLTSNGMTRFTSFEQYDHHWNLLYGTYTETWNLSGLMTDDAKLVFRLRELGETFLEPVTVSKLVDCVECPPMFFTESIAGVDNVNVTPVPEPATVLLLGAGLVGVAGVRKQFKK